MDGGSIPGSSTSRTPRTGRDARHDRFWAGCSPACGEIHTQLSQRPSGFGEQLGVDDEEARRLAGRPCRHASAMSASSSARRDAELDGSVGQRGVGRALGPRVRPPRPVVRRGEAPRGRRRRDAARAQQPSPRRRGGGRRPARLRWPGRPCDTCRNHRCQPGAPATTSSPGSRRRARRSCRPDGRAGASRPAQRRDRRGAAGPGGHGPRRRMHRLVEVVHVAGAEREVGGIVIAARGGDDVAGGVEARHLPGVHPPCEVGRDRARSAPDVEDGRARHQRGQQVGGGVLRGPPPMRAEHRIGVAVGVASRAPRDSQRRC